ncbi:hypothetical protein R6Q57_002117 [Mikania cordata]
MASDTNSSPTTTFVQADPSNFRAVVQRLTGATPTPQCGPKSPHRSGFKLQERRQSTRKLEITLDNGFHQFGIMHPQTRHRRYNCDDTMMSSPVSTLDVCGKGSPRTPVEDEQKAIAEKGFHLHLSPRNTPRGSEPELLVLFPLCSPKTDLSSRFSGAD